MAEINNPSYYQFHHPAYEMADITIRMPHALGSAMEYLYRAGNKPGNTSIDDLYKARWWIDRYIQEYGHPVQDDDDGDEIF